MKQPMVSFDKYSILTRWTCTDLKLLNEIT